MSKSAPVSNSARNLATCEVRPLTLPDTHEETITLDQQILSPEQAHLLNAPFHHVLHTANYKRR